MRKIKYPKLIFKLILKHLCPYRTLLKILLGTVLQSSLILKQDSKQFPYDQILLNAIKKWGIVVGNYAEYRFLIVFSFGPNVWRILRKKKEIPSWEGNIINTT